MSTPADWLRIQEAMTAIRDMNSVSIVFRRGTATLAAQTVRVERRGQGQTRTEDSTGGQQATAAVVILGATTLDIQVSDRFTLAGVLYEVRFVSPNRKTATQAEAVAIE